MSAPGWRPTAKESPAETEVEHGTVGGPVADTELMYLVELLELDSSALKASSKRKQALLRGGEVGDEASLRKPGKQSRLVVSIGHRREKPSAIESEALFCPAVIFSVTCKARY